MHATRLVDEARYFLLEELRNLPLDGENILKLIVVPQTGELNDQPLAFYYQRLLMSAKNAHMKAKVIKSILGTDDDLGEFLFEFDPHKVIEFLQKPENTADATSVMREYLLEKCGKSVPDAKVSIFSRYCRTITSAAEFIVQFKDGSELRAWFELFYKDTRMKEALPLLISEEVYGLGYTLACDFLKEIGLVNYGKPDVHIKDILCDLGFADVHDSPYRIQKNLGKLADKAGVTPYELDKLLWLVGSGLFYPVDLGDGTLSKEFKLSSTGMKRKERFVKRFNSTV